MDYVEKDFGKILKRNAQELRHDNLPEGTDCMRVYDRNLEEYPVTVDLYGRLAKVVDFGEEPMDDERRASCLDVCARMLYLDPADIVYSYRAKRPDGEQHEKTQQEAKKTIVHEDGLSFEVDLTTYVDTGLFLDHSKLRHYVRERSEGRRVLNLFSYTGSFSVYAAAGLAKEVTSVDMSATYTRWAQQNLERNGYTGENYECVCMDAGKFIAEAREDHRKYDIIIFDPPCFSNSHKMDHDFDVARDWADWVARLTELLSKDGVIVFSTNLSSFRMDRRKVRGLKVRELTSEVKAPGFVKGRMGTARSWIMAMDDESLTLDWSEPKQTGSEEKTETEKKPYEKKQYDRKPYGKKPYDRKPYDRDNYGRDRREGGSYGHREGGYNRDGYGRDRREGGSYGHREGGYDRKPAYDRDGERRSFDRPSYGDKPYGNRSYGERREGGYDRKPSYNRDGERRSYDKPSYSDRPRRSYDRDGERSYERKEYGRNEWHGNDENSQNGEERNFERKPSYERRSYGERREGGYDRKPSFDRGRSYDRDRKPSYNRDGGERRSFDRSSSYGDRPRKSYGDRDGRDFHRGEEGGGYKQNKDFRRGNKPYGYDSFRPARSRDDSAGFFWNSDENEKNDKKDVD